MRVIAAETIASVTLRQVGSIAVARLYGTAAAGPGPTLRWVNCSAVSATGWTCRPAAPRADFIGAKR